jgi:hypothetical protein
MRIVPLVVAIVFLSTAVFAGEIREFDIPTLERLGSELSHRDEIAARASDAVLGTQPAARALKLRGWITEPGKSEDKVHLIAETASGPCLAYTVTFSGSGKPQVEDRRGQALPPNVAVRYKARNTAANALKGRLFNIKYNFEVLNDPDGSGFLVYALGATTDPDEVVLAGHFRVTVSADGLKRERVDALSRTLVVQPKNLKSGTVALFLIQLVSDKPVETLIYTSNLVRLPIAVGTPNRHVWSVANGKMEDTGKLAEKK